MGRKSKYSIEVKIQAVLDYKSGKKSKREISRDLGMSEIEQTSGHVVENWINIYDKYGEEGLLPKERNKSYSKEFKEKVVEEYLNGTGSFGSLCLKYDIPSKETLRTWVNRYNSHEELKDYNPKGEVYMASARRKTTIEERVKIVQYCLEHNKEYKIAAEAFDVSYTQVYQWVKKYEEYGEDGLSDKRGKRKEETQLSELEKLQRENARLKKQLELKERENYVLKKLKEIERSWDAREYVKKQSTKR
ncbi:MAG: transposase [Erysipelotrichales bacterium]|nr:transposase [Erysipelotrichales bacterium]